jgi:hypothetical protein
VAKSKQQPKPEPGPATRKAAAELAAKRRAYETALAASLGAVPPITAVGAFAFDVPGCGFDEGHWDTAGIYVPGPGGDAVFVPGAREPLPPQLAALLHERAQTTVRLRKLQADLDRAQQHYDEQAEAEMRALEERLRAELEAAKGQEPQLPRRGTGARQAEENRVLDALADYYDRQDRLSHPDRNHDHLKRLDRDIAGRLGDAAWHEWYSRDRQGNLRKFDPATEKAAKGLMEQRVMSAMKRLRERRQKLAK